MASATDPSAGPGRRAVPAAALVVWAVWAAMTAADLAWVAYYSRDIPLMDEWVMVPALTGHQPISWAWVWAQHNEHRFALTRLILLGVYRLGGYDFRAGTPVNVGLMAVMTAALILAARRLRGRTSFADAFFPLTLLHWGQSENFWWSWQLVFIVPVALALVVLCVMVRQGHRLTLRAGLLAGVCLALLPLCGTMGLAQVPAAACWLAACGLTAWRSAERHGRRDGACMLALAAASLALVGVYFIGLQRPEGTESHSLAASLVTSCQFLSLGFGLVYKPFWWVWGLLSLGLLVAGTLILVRVWLRQPAERLRAFGLLCFLAGIAALAIGVGWRREGYGLARRYITLMAPGLCCAYFVFLVYGRPRPGRVVNGLLALVMALMLIQNTTDEHTAFFSQNLERFQHDLEEGQFPSVLGARYSSYPFSLYPDAKILADYMVMLHRAGIGPFRQVREDPAYRVVPVDEKHVTRPDEHQFILKQPRFVYALRLKCAYQPRAEAALFQATWQPAPRDGRPARPVKAEVPLLQELKENAVTFWVNDTITRFTLHPDTKPYSCTLWDIELLVPAEPPRE
jgi:hypothetical protein